MSEPRDDQSYLWDMLEAAKCVVEFSANLTYERYLQDKLCRSAIERQIEIIGEAARSISKEFRSEHAAIQWQGIIAQRHVLAHDYGELKHDRIWRVATVHVPQLILQLEPLLVPVDDDGNV